MNAIEYKMLGLFQIEATPIAEKYGIRIDIDWGNGDTNFVTEKEMSKIKLQKFLTEMTAVIQKYPIFKNFRRC